jgi:histidine triad (HIT) family protein
MTLTKEQISTLKKQFLEQIKHLPEEQKKEAESQIENLSDEAIKSMLESQKESQIKIFREIVTNKIPSKKVGENKEAIAVLDIKPLSKGHTIIIPKNPINNINQIPKNISAFAEEIAKKLSSNLKINNIKIIPETKFNEVIINLIPTYDEEISLKNERLNPSEEELEKTLEQIIKKPEIKEKVIEVKKEEKKEIIKLKKRIP